MTGELRIGLLGPFELSAEGRPLDVSSAKQRLVLAMLAVADGAPVGAEAIAAELWGPSPDVDVPSSLQNLVSRLRRVLGEAAQVAIRDNGYLLVPAPEVDVFRFERLVADRSAEALTEALALWRGPALAEWAERPFARATAARLTEARHDATESLAELHLADGRPATAVGLLEPLVADEPFREDAWRRLMLALYRAGRQADALSAYRKVRAVLADELGLEPGPALRRLERLIFEQSPELDPPVETPMSLRAFLFTDIEASTKRWEGEGVAMAADLARHDALLRECVRVEGGAVLSHTGDGLCAEFPAAAAAARAALAGQRALTGQHWQGRAPLRVRMAVHVGTAQARDGNWFGPTLNRTARLMALAAGGQVLCSSAAAELVRDDPPIDATLVELGEHELADLDRPERVFELTHPELPQVGRVATRAAAHNLPTPVGEFVGREVEIAELTDLLARQRLITLWGPGGVGKTRLSLELATRTVPRFADGAWFVELAPLDRADLVAPAVMSALGMLPVGADPVAALVGYLRRRTALLVLDNCEHLLDPVARLVAAVLAGCPGVGVLSSSREPLRVAGEYVWPARSLALPDPDAELADLMSADAVVLFCERATLAHPGFALTEANAAAVGEICRRLDGMPLALELAAPRVRALGVKGIVDHLDDRFRLLTDGSRTADARHQTLLAAVQWSHDLLPQAERDLLACLSVFPGTFDAAAVQAMAPAAPNGRPAGFDVLDLLTRLVDRSLVVPVAVGDDIRYRLLETIRQYAAERLGLPDEVRRRHLDHFLTGPIVSRGFRADWELYQFADIEPEHDNLRCALEYALDEHDVDAAVRIAAALVFYWLNTGNRLAGSWMRRILESPGLPQTAPTAFVAMADAWWRHDARSGAHAMALAEKLGDPATLAVVQHLSADVRVCPDPVEARARLTAAISLTAAAGLDAATAGAYRTLAWVDLRAGDLAAAYADAAQAAEMIPTEHRTTVRSGQIFGVLAVCAALSGEADRARQAAEDTLRCGAAVAAPAGILTLYGPASAAFSLSGDWARARECLRDQIVILRRLAITAWVGDALEFSALTLEGLGRPDLAATVLASAAQQRQRTGEPMAGGIPAIATVLTACADRLPSPPPPWTPPADTEDALAAALEAFA